MPIRQRLNNGPATNSARQFAESRAVSPACWRLSEILEAVAGFSEKPLPRIVKPKNQSFFSGSTTLLEGIIVVPVSFEVNDGPLPICPTQVLSEKNPSNSTRTLRESKRVIAAGLLPATFALSAAAEMPESAG